MSRQRTLVLLGGGGHGAVVAEAARAGYGNGAIPPNATLTIDIELVEIE